MEFDELSNKVMDWQLKLNRFIRFIFQFFVLFVSFVVKIILGSDLFGLGIVTSLRSSQRHLSLCSL